MEKVFGTYYDDSEFDDGKLPDSTGYLRENNIFSYGSDDAQRVARQFRTKLNAGETILLLGLNAGHNSGISLIEASRQGGIQVLANLEEERYVAIKHFAGYPEKSVREMIKLLSRIGKTPRDIFCVLYAWDSVQEEKYGQKMFMLNGKIVRNKYFAHISAGATPALELDPAAVQKRKNLYNHSPGLVELFIRLTRELQLKKETPCVQTLHHENHAYFSYGVSPFYQTGNSDKTTMISCIDGGGDFSSTSLFLAKGGQIDLIKRLPRENSLGVFYMLCASFLGGWSALSSEGRYMGAAAWGNNERLTNRYYKRLRQFFFFSGNGELFINSTMAENDYATLQDIVGPFVPIEDIWNPDAILNVDDIKHSEITRDRVDKAAAVQMVFEDALFHIIGYLIDKTRSDQLVMCGGTALNCVANMRLLKHFNEDYYRKYVKKDTQLNIWVPPVPSDQGVVVGAAYQFAMRNGAEAAGKLPTPFLCGYSTGKDSIRQALQEVDFVRYEKLGNIYDKNTRESITDWMAYIVSENGVIGIYQGEAETGPRALGHRSILANPCNADTLNILNSRVKLREKVRPLAPMLTMESAKKWYRLSKGGSANNYDAYNYMVLTVEAKEEAKAVIPAVIHYDGTSRIQIVREENNILMYEYLRALGKYIGVEVSVNTSLNVGSPIVQTPFQALSIFKRAKGLDAIFMVGAEGDAFMVWAKEGVQEFDSNIPRLSKSYKSKKTELREKSSFMNNPKDILRALKEKRISLLEAKENLEKISNEKPIDSLHQNVICKSKSSSGNIPSRDEQNNRQPIAIIGMSGVFPDAKNVHQFWENLKNARNSVSDAPKDRGWNIEDYYNVTPQTPGKSYVTRGGFLRDIDKFDPLFFGILPREAELMDPSERLFLQESWRAIEDAGYSAASLSGKCWGVFACAKGDYSSTIQKMDKTYLSTSDSFAAARLSYLLNLVGPAVSVDTACSSTLAAIAYACDSLALGNCEVAIAGGGGIYTTPNMLISSSQSLLFSADEKCYTFDQRANGTVFGEAIGSVILKPLRQAVLDRDHIYGVIKGWGTNQDGKTNGMLAPSVGSQTQLQTNVYQKFNINPEHISMVEAHGTGTKLGDPIEVQALTESFQKFTQKTEYCALGSVKTNIGHAFFGSGISGVIKVLLSLQHSQIAPTLNFETINPYIHIKGSPFFINTSLQSWNTEGNRPRCAAINSFGATGINVHLVVEEYKNQLSTNNDQLSVRKEPSLILLSAKDEDRLKEMAENLQTYLTVNCDSEHSMINGQSPISLADLAYTLQIGREAMEERLGMVVESFQELEKKLKAFIEGKRDVVQLYRGKVSNNSEGIVLQTEKHKFPELAALWVKGGVIDWNKFYEAFNFHPDRISLPTYPFAKERYWIEAEEKGLISTKSGRNGRPVKSYLHPFLHENTSDLFEQRFSSTFTGEEFFLRDHLVDGEKVLPGVAYLEMAQEAVKQASGMFSKNNGVDIPQRIQLKNVVWTRPILVNGLQEVHIGLFPEENGAISYEIYTDNQNQEEEPIVHSQGVAILPSLGSPPSNKSQTLNLEELQAKLNQNNFNSQECYETFKAMGIDYGPSHQGLEKVYLGENEVLAKLTLPISVSETKDQFSLHPSLLDSALQASIVMSFSGSAFRPSQLSLPFALESLEIINSCSESMWAWVRLAQPSVVRLTDSEDSERSDRVDGRHVQKLDIDLCDDAGEICVKMQGFASRVLKEEPDTVQVTTTSSEESAGAPVGLLTLRPVWNTIFEETRYIEKEAISPEEYAQIVLIGGTQKQQETIKKLYHQIKTLEIESDANVGTISKQLDELDSIDHIVWIASESTVESVEEKQQMIQDQNWGVLQVFQIIKALLSSGYGVKDLAWTVITTQTQAVRSIDLINPTHAGVHGLIGSLAKEYPHWKVRLLDMEKNGYWPIQEMFRLPYNVRGDALAYRDKEWFARELLHVRELPEQTVLYKTGGVYVVIGGVGGIGEAWSKWMIEKYQAKIVWIGRRAKDPAIQKKLDALSKIGPAPIYIQADAANKESLEKAYQQIIQTYSQINGVVHSAIVLLDSSLARMDEERFKAGLQAKVDVSVRMAEVFEAESLDFLLFFSSMIVFGTAVGQSNYAAGCAFKDAFAGKLSQDWSCPVKVMNWGYWGSVGIVSDQSTRDRMEKIGIGSIGPEEGLEALEKLLNGPLDQVALIRTLKADAMNNIAEMIPNEWMSCYPQTLPSKTMKSLESALTSGLDAKWNKITSNGKLQNPKMETLFDQLLLANVRPFLKSKDGLLGRYDRWIEESFSVLLTKNYLKQHDDNSYTLVNGNGIALEDLWGQWDQQKISWIQDTDKKAQVVLAEACLRAMPDILTGKVKATDVMFPNSSMELVEGIYKGNLLSDLFHDVLGETLVSYIQESLSQDGSSQFRILEIGAGTGGSTDGLLSKLRPFQDHIREYCYTDLSKAFLLHARENYVSRAPYLTTRIFDVEKPIAEQNIQADRYDVVIAANVLHATRNIRQTLRNVKASMRKGGVLLLNELSGKSQFAHLTFGLLEGWWLYEDTGLRIPGSPGLYPETWRRVLNEEGFVSTFFPAEKGHQLGQQIIVAQSDGIVRQKLGASSSISSTQKSIRPRVLKKSFTVKEKFQTVSTEGTTLDSLRGKSTKYIKRLIAETLKMKSHQIDSSKSLEAYGIDSILVVHLTNTLRKVFNDISSTLFFEVQTIDGLVEHLIKTQKETLICQVGFEEQKPKEETGFENSSHSQSSALFKPRAGRLRRFKPTVEMEASESQDSHTQDVAIIGLSGRYPQAENMDEFWGNLKAGKNCISEIPRDRWDWRQYFDEEKGKPGKIYTKWGGFLKDVDQFDPIFFHISPREAKQMDPQERLFLEEAYKSIEDSGYTPQTLSDSRKIGVFVGVMNGTYAHQSSYWSIANRISYLLDFKGPSMAIDTACSSSLTAIHLALESLHSGMSECAIAGGVNLILKPIHYLRLSAMTALSSTDECKPFGDEGDGFVDGEGVGAIVLKPLKKAISDQDHIYGIIKGSMVNSGGKTNGYTIPNPNAQYELISGALKRSNIDARAVSYVEAHGTGTVLGDPIEISGLTRAFEEYSKEKQYCSIGSVKSNIGHSESAAGIGSVTKVLLQLKYSQLVPSLHSKVLNSNIDFTSTPFVVNQELRDWQNPVIDGKEYPRIAGISSFGAGGSNVHLLIEEYIPDKQKVRNDVVTSPDPVIIVLSARNQESLKEYAKKLLKFVQRSETPNTETNGMAFCLTELAYTLQVGREAMEERLGCIVHSTQEIENKLRGFIEGKEDIEDLYHGQVKQNKDTFAVFEADEDMPKIIDIWITKGKYDKLLDLWVKGLTVDWNKLYGENRPQKISAPTYPFARKSYWMESQGPPVAESSKSIEIRDGQDLPPASRTLFLPGNVDKIVSSDNIPKPSQISLLDTKDPSFTLKSNGKNQNTKEVTFGVLKKTDILEDLKSATPDGVKGMVPTLNRTGVMLEKLTPCSESFAEYAGQCEGEVLDIGCAYGVATIAALERGARVLATDMEQQHLDILKDRISDEARQHLSTQQGLIQDIDFEDGRFAAIHASRVIHFLKPEDVQNAIQKMHRWLQPGGKLFLVTDTPYVGYWKSKALEYKTRKAAGDLWPGYIEDVRKIFSAQETDGAPPLINPLDPDILSRECRDAGFDVEKVGFEGIGVDMGIKDPDLAGMEHVGVIARKPIDRILSTEESTFVRDKDVIQKDPETTDARSQVSSVLEDQGALMDETVESIQSRIRSSLGDELHMKAEEIDDETTFIDLGVDSIVGVTWIRKINTQYGLSIAATRIYDYPTIHELAVFLKKELKKRGGELIQRPSQQAVSRSSNEQRSAAPHSVKIAKSCRPPIIRDSGIKQSFEDLSKLGDHYGLVLSKVHVFEELHLSQWVVSEPKANEVTIRVKASAINFGDVLCVKGLYPNIPDYPFVPGGEVSGIVSKVGDQVSGVSIGDEVIALTELGGHASYVNVPETNVVNKPENISFEDACSLPIVFWTVNHAFELGKLAHKEHVLIQTASGGCGLIAIQLARLKDCICYGTSSRSEKIEYLKKLEIPYAINYKTSEFDQEIKRITNNHGVDVVLNTLSGDNIQKGLNCLGRSGRYLEIATHALKTSPKLDLSKLLQNQSIYSINLGLNWYEPDPLDTSQNIFLGEKSLRLMVSLLESDKIVPITSRIYPIHQIVDALEYVSQGQHIGKVILSHTHQDMIDFTDNCIERMLEQKRKAEKLAPSIKIRSSIGTEKRVEDVTEGVAIIGMSGQFPQAKTLDLFWKNISQGKDCVSEVPATRWSNEKYYDADNDAPGKTSCKWMGALEDVDQFDPLFFNISPAEAHWMDPQQRLFLESAWHCIEDAGINPVSLSGSSCGVFVGCGNVNYGQSMGEQGLNAQGLLGGSSSILSARISYFLNLKGPCLAIDTACSSSLVAIAEACNSLMLKTSDLTLAGGVCAFPGPSLHILGTKAGMYSKEGRCFTFDQRANGFVPGEGVGVILLKRLSDAVRDGDQIHGVIKGWGVNQDGKTNGITAPSVNSQISLEKELYERFHINPETISLVEAHGTGTTLGDPIEVEALTESFKAYTDKKKYCALGSVKSNIGHLLTAAGIAGVIKVLLALRQKMLPPTIHFEKLNQHISLEESPFYVNTELQPWEASPDIPRRASVSSFGFSGTNAHMVIEEYNNQSPIKSDQLPVKKGPALIVLSAQNGERLKEMVKNLHAYLTVNCGSEQSMTNSQMSIRLEDLAYTLQVGREAMKERLGLIVHSMRELEEKLQGFIDGRENVEDLYLGQVERNKDALAVFTDDDDLQKTIEAWVSKKHYSKLLGLWVKGLAFDWKKLYGDTVPKRVSLPTYPFARDRYWVEEECPDKVVDSTHEAIGTLVFKPVWKEKAVDPEQKISEYTDHLVFLCGLNQKRQLLQDKLPHLSLVDLESNHKTLEKRFEEYSLGLFTTIQKILQGKPKGNVLLQVLVPAQGIQQTFSALSGILKTARLENPRILGQVIAVRKEDSIENMVTKVQANSRCPEDQQIRYEGDQRLVASFEEIIKVEKDQTIPWKNGGVYLITGGAGGLGLIFAKEIVEKEKDVTLILTGRSDLSKEKKARLDELERLGGKTEYKSVDVSDKKAVNALVLEIQNNSGGLNGIIHSAGVIRDNFILKKTKAEFEQVLAPKVEGVMNLDHAAKELDLDFFVLFSSGAGVTGSIGQADYSTANAFMDAFSKYRNSLLDSRQRRGQTLSINWPLWRDGGMGIDETAEEMMKESMGMVAMETSSGIEAFYQALVSRESQVVVMKGLLEKMKSLLLSDKFDIKPDSNKTSISKAEDGLPDQASSPLCPIDPKMLKERTLHQLKGLFGEMIKLSASKIDPEEPFESYGIDSFMITQMNQRLESVFGEISKTLFYEYQTLVELTDYLIANYSQVCTQWAGIQEQTKLGQPSSILEKSLSRQPFEGENPTRHSTEVKTGQSRGFTGAMGRNRAQEPIAVIGMSGRYPQAKNLEEYWENLKSGKNCIVEVPGERWDWKKYYQEDPNKASVLRKSYSKWGGFLERCYEFDPLFFNITPRDAGNIDPQERLFLEEAWKALEDAGYAPSRLSPHLRQRTGVFAGITKQGFNLYTLEKEGILPTTSFSSLVNRVSYCMNLQGPSIPIDTMCSSALVAIHEACEYLRHGNGMLAIVGAVNLYLHPLSYVGLSMAQIISQTRDSAAFEKGGSGFVPGEGVGAVILKPYSLAVQDQDSIYALIQGTAVNHGGKTNAYTVPNPNQQVSVIQQALEQNNLDPRSISYIESSANGSEMGDAIEMTALTKVFAKREGTKGSYRIGSVKPNIGHSESASGMSQLSKIIFSLKHKTLVPTLIKGELNPNIRFDQLPFQLQQEVSEWTPVTIDGVEMPRRAGITSIGAGGVNAHIIVEEYIPGPKRSVLPRGETVPTLFILSAKNQDRLEEYVKEWIRYLEMDPKADLERITYTLQVGREEMPSRLAVVSLSQNELLVQLKEWMVCRENSETCYSGNVETVKVKTHEEVDLAIETKSLREIARLWILGNGILWKNLYAEKKLSRVTGLPTYPFMRKQCRIHALPGDHQIVSENQVDRISQSDDNKAVEFYSLWAKESIGEFQEEYLTFCPFPEKIPGFSMTRMILTPDEYPDEVKSFVRARQIEMRQVLFCKEDFNRIQTFFDFGCGHGTDVIQVAKLYPHIQTHGFTITQDQADLGNRRIARCNLGSRAKVFHKDSSKDEFPGRYDLIIGIEVSFHIRDKDGLFQNIVSSLREDGKVLLMDQIANLRGAIVDPNVEISIPTQKDWVDLLSKHHLVIDEIIDVSPQIANFLFDPELEQNIKGGSKVVQDTLRNYAHQSMALEKGWISYCLFKLRKDECLSDQERWDYNMGKLLNPTPYPEALEEMLDRGEIPYPKPEENQKKQFLSQFGTKDKIGQKSIVESHMQLLPEEIIKIKASLLRIFIEALGLQREEIEAIKTFQELGITSINAVELLERVNIYFNLNLPTSVVFEANTLDSLARYIQKSLLETFSGPKSHNDDVSVSLVDTQTVVKPQGANHANSVIVQKFEKKEDIAIIGLSCRCAGANDQDKFWELVSQGKDCIGKITNTSWLDFFSQHSSGPIPGRYGQMAGIEYFDPMFFNISPKEAESMDVTQRIVLEESYRALEDAGYAPSSLREQPVGTFLGAMGNAPMAQDFSHFSMLGSETSILSSRLAYFLDLKGPALAINTACSSSLVAIDLACQQLKSHEINLAIAGGITIYTHPGAFITMNNAGMLSLTGECRPFDNMANGIVVGDGVGIVILKRLKDAERDRDRIYGIIRGSGTNQDGQTSGITVPSFMSQSQLEESIYRKNKINVEDIQYIEAHGTATKLGDPVEIHALNHSFQKFTEKRGFCAIGSLKGNIGHTTAAAGVLGVIKVLLSLKYHKLPPSIHFSKGNEHIDFERSPLYVNTKLQEWQAGPKGSRLAAVSSFGFSGTNAHMVIGEYNNHLSMKNDQLSMKTGPALIVLSAKNEDRLKEMVKNLHSYLTVHCEPDLSKVNGKSSISLADLAYTLQVGREAMEERLGFLVESLQELDTKLQRFIEGQGYEEDLYRGQAKPNTETLAVLTVDEDIAKAIDSWIDKRKFSKLLALWTKGLNFDWNKLYRDAKPSRISLPTYPFAKEHYRSNTFASQDQIETNDNCRIKRVDANSDQVSAPEVQEPLDTMCFEEVWQETALPEIISKASLSPNGRRPK